MLLGTDIAQLAQTALTRIVHLTQNIEDLLTTTCEFAVALTFLQHLQGISILCILDEPAAAMTAIVIHEKRLVALGARCQCRQVAVGVSLVVVGTAVYVFLKVVKHCSLRPGARYHHYRP